MGISNCMGALEIARPSSIASLSFLLQNLSWPISKGINLPSILLNLNIFKIGINVRFFFWKGDI